MLRKLLALHNRMVFKVPYPQYYVLLNVKSNVSELSKIK